MALEPDSATAKPRRGRRPGTSSSRDEILQAARARFAADGFAGTTLRKIAADAGVDAALVIQFFRSKEGLFAAAMSIPPTVMDRIAGAFDGPKEGLGERVARTMLSVWEDDPADYEPLLAMFRSMVGHEQSAEQMREFVQARLVEGLSPLLGTSPDATLRVGLAITMLIGVIIGRRVVQVPALKHEDQQTVARAVGPALQLLLVPNG